MVKKRVKNGYKGGKEDKKEGGYTRIERSKRRYEAKEKKLL